MVLVLQNSMQFRLILSFHTTSLHWSRLRTPSAVFAVNDRIGEIASPNGGFGALVPNSGYWSITATQFDEINATLPTVGLIMRMPGLEEAVLKVDGRLSVFCSHSHCDGLSYSRFLRLHPNYRHSSCRNNF